MSKKEKTNAAILYCSPLNIGGVETHLLSLLRHSEKSHYSWYVFSQTSAAFKEKAEEFGAEVIPWAPSHALDPRALISLVALIRKHRIDILHAHSARAAIFAQIAASLAGIRVMVTVHQPLCALAYEKGSLGDSKRWYRYYIAVARLLNKLSDKMIYVSFRAFREAFDAGLTPLERTVVIENGIDLTRYEKLAPRSSIRKMLGIEPETMVISCVARLHEQKGIDILFEALRLLQPYSGKFLVLIVGDGHLDSLLRKQAGQMGLEGIVRFLGFRTDVPDILGASDLFVLPSRFECMSIGIMEAMAAGLACVVTDVGEAYRVIEQGVSGFIVPPEDPYALSEAIKRLLLDETACKKMGRKARKRSEEYSDVRMVENTLKEYSFVEGSRE